MRHFYLYDADVRQVARLRALVAAQPPRDTGRREPRRHVAVTHGDFNAEVHALLDQGVIRGTEATFCLLDQRTFECHWATVQALALHRHTGRKIELFYFLPNAWLDRALAAQQDVGVLERWWGRRDWEILRAISGLPRAQIVVRRFKDEFGYRSAKALPIYERADESRVMYYMIHATDHPDAPPLMARAYRRAVLPKESPQQLALELGLDSLQPPTDAEE